jgi:hypothetical protein
MHKIITPRFAALKYCIIALSLTSCNIRSYDESDTIRNGLIIAGIGAAAYCSGYFQKTKRAKGHTVQQATDQLSIAVPGSGRWHALSYLSQGSLVISGALALTGTLLVIPFYKNWLDYPDSSEAQEPLIATCFLNGLFYSAAALSYEAKKIADYKIEKFKEEYILANPETYKEQLCKNKDFVVAQNEIVSF